MDILKKIESHILNGNFFRISFIGDSITSTEWVHPNWREIVEYVLKEVLSASISDWKIPSWKIRCFNSGFDGSTTKDILELLPEGILINKPNLVLMMIGDNDVHLGSTTPEEYLENIKLIISKLKSNGADEIYILTPIPSNQKEVNSMFLPYLNSLRKAKPLKDAKLVDIWEDFENLDLDKFFTFVSLGNEVVGMKPGDLDFLHPNQLGNTYIAKFILKKVFDIDFDPEKYIKDNVNGVMYPEY